MRPTFSILMAAGVAAAACRGQGPTPLSAVSLADCTPTGVQQTQSTTMPPSGDLHLKTGAGVDELVVPAGSAAAGATFKFTRLGSGTSRVRRVSAEPPSGVNGAGSTITIDANGCSAPAGKSLAVGRQEGATWVVVGAHPSAGGGITSDPLDHLSIYAVVSN